MFKIISIALAITICIAGYAQAAEKSPAQQSPKASIQQQNKSPYQNIKKQGENKIPSGENLSLPEGKQPKKGQRPNKKPDAQPGGDKTPPELQ